MKEQTIRILNVVPNMRAAGIETFIMNVYRNIDRNKIQFDFLVHSQKKEFYDEEIEKLGGKIYRLTYKDDKNFLKYVKDLKNFFIEHKEYKIVHGHMQSMMPIYLCIAKKCNVPIRIAHAHNSDFEKTIKGFILHVLSRFAKRYSTINFACSNIAGKYLFGNNDFTFIPNAINTEKFIFNENDRKEIRKRYNIKDDEILIGHVGRFEIQKNHIRLIQIFKEFLANNKNSKLILVGKGKLEESIEKLIKKEKIENKVIFAGVQKETEKFYSAMDVFLFPSLYEGLPVTGIEAQTSGAICIFSDTITKEVNITNEIEYISLKSKNMDWVKKIENCLKKKENRITYYKIVSNSDFEIKRTSEKIEDLYIKLKEESGD